MKRLNTFHFHSRFLVVNHVVVFEKFLLILQQLFKKKPKYPWRSVINYIFSSQTCFIHGYYYEEILRKSFNDFHEVAYGLFLLREWIDLLIIIYILI